MSKSVSKNGKVYLVGAGPGDLGLVTLRAKECIENADVFVYDHLANPDMLGWARDDAEIIYAGKQPGESRTQTEITSLLIDKAREGKQVVRLKGGDPFVFGRGAEEAQEIATAGIPFEIVPGITSAIAGPAYAGIPMTHRAHNSHVTFFTGHEDPTKTESAIDYAALAKLGGTQVMLMGVERLGDVTSEMLKHGVRADLPVALVRWATTGQQETLTGMLSDIAQKVAAKNFEAPAVAVFGDVVLLRDALNWYEKRPLLGKRIVVTRTRKQASALSNKLRALGAHVIELPTIRIEPPSNLREFAELVQDAHVYDWIVFTSANGVEAFFDIFFKLYDDAREIGGVRIAWCANSRNREASKTSASLWCARRRRATFCPKNSRPQEQSWTQRSRIGRYLRHATRAARSGNSLTVAQTSSRSPVLQQSKTSWRSACRGRKECASPALARSRQRPSAITDSTSILKRVATILTACYGRSGSCLLVERLKQLHRYNDVPNLLVVTFVTVLGIESKLHSGALGVGPRLAAMLLRRRLERAQTADFLENALGIQLVFQPLQCAIDRFTFAHNHFWHQ